jgi:predicted CXXCH cytochrome family protein
MAGQLTQQRKRLRRPGLVGTLTAALLTLAAAPAAPGAPGGVGTPILVGLPGQAFTIEAEPALHLPSDVSVAASGEVFIADGVGHRILRFAPDGQLLDVLTHAGDQPLRDPMSVHVTPDGRAWIADTGNDRVVTWSPAAKVIPTANTMPAANATNVIPLQPVTGGALDITDVLPSDDGQRLWLVDNDGHRVLTFERQTGQWRATGHRGTALGEFDYPFMLAPAGGGDVVVTDVINGRLVLLDAALEPVRALGQYGVRVGEFYRPKGVARDSRGWLWISDSDLGVVQVYTPTGAFIGVLRDPAGQPLKLASPTGLAFGPDGDLYVAELAADRVRRIAITVDADAPREGPLNRPHLVSDQPRNCTACHLEWMAPLDRGEPTELIDVPPDSAEHPYVSRAPVCLSCHDGSVADSRRRVWLEHGHQTGIAPPPEMAIDALPLVEGEIVCRTCHSAHTRGGAGDILKEAVFLRVDESPTELCYACHQGFDGGVAAGMHPLGKMAIPLPAALQSPHTTAPANDVTCLGCHSGHGAPRSNLLKLSVQDNSACLSCHAQLRPERFAAGKTADKPIGHHGTPILTPTQLAATEQLGARVGENNQLLCITCHASHNAAQPRHLMAYDAPGSTACESCHTEQRVVANTPHDIAAVAPTLTTHSGQAAADVGSCRSCHGAHRYALELQPNRYDAVGHCMACHGDGKGGATILTAINHPSDNCGNCHEPHDLGVGHFMPQPAADTCSDCHPDYADLRVAGPHRLTTGPDSPWPAVAQQTDDACLACHRPHGNAKAGLMRIASQADQHTLGRNCLACHTEVMPAGHAAILHPQGTFATTANAASSFSSAQTNSPDTPPSKNETELAAGDDPGHAAASNRGLVDCYSCHNPHADGAASQALLNIQANQPSVTLCYDCHADRQGVILAGHGHDQLQAAGLSETDHCLPCHQTHGQRADVGPTLWPAELHASIATGRRAIPDSPSTTVTPTDAGGQQKTGLATTTDAPSGPGATAQPTQTPRLILSPRDTRCLACHGPDGVATQPAARGHPDLVLIDPYAAGSSDAASSATGLTAVAADEHENHAGDKRSPLPLFNPAGQPAARGTIACATCHLPHGRTDVNIDSLSQRSPAEIQARKLHLRPFTQPNVCTTCHGPDALRRFQFYHDPLRRGGPVRNR